MPWFEDIMIGIRTDFGAHTFTEEEIIAFARQFDPQPFHIDPEAARTGPFGGLVASGWHTTAMWMRYATAGLQAAERPGDPPGGPSPGFLELRWPSPVRPGDTIRFSQTVAEKIESRSRPDRGIVRMRAEGHNQHGALVLSFIAQGIMFRRGKEAP